MTINYTKSFKFLMSIIFCSVCVSCNSSNQMDHEISAPYNQSNFTEYSFSTDDIKEFGTLNNGILAVHCENSVYYVDTSGAPLFNQTYHYAGDFRSNGTALVKKMVDGGIRSFLIDTNGEQIVSIDPSYQNISHDLSGEYLQVSPNKWSDFAKKNGLIDKNGKTIIPVEDGSIYLTKHWAVRDVRLEKCTFIDLKTGAIVATYDGQFGGNAEGLVSIISDHHFYIDSTGKNPFHNSYYWSDDFKEGLAKVTDRFDIWFINYKGQRAFDRVFRYESLDHFQRGFSEGLCPIFTEGEWHIINQSGKTLFKVNYDDVWEFENGYAITEQNYQFGLIDKKGKTIFPCENKFIIEPIYEGLFIKYDDINTAVLINEEGDQYPLTFDKISNFENGVAIGLINGELKPIYLKDVCEALNIKYK